MRLSITSLLCLALIGVSLPQGAVAQTCVSGTITAEYNADPAYPGMWRYCVEASWDLGRYELSHLDVFLQLPTCDCICDPRFIRFLEPAGHAVNTSPGYIVCELDYYGDYVCKGDPSLPSQYDGPAVKFEPDEYSGCSPGVRGHGTFCFFSPMPPQDGALYAQGLAIKHGQQICYGLLEGQLPSCDCALPTHTSTWGALKATYR